MLVDGTLATMTMHDLHPGSLQERRMGMITLPPCLLGPLEAPEENTSSLAGTLWTRFHTVTPCAEHS